LVREDNTRTREAEGDQKLEQNLKMFSAS